MMLHISLLLISGLLLGLPASRLGIPRVAAYVAAGVVFSPDVFGSYMGFELGPWTESLTSIALSIIAYIVGGSITVQQLRRLGGIIVSTTLGESLGALIAVLAFLLVLAPAVEGVSSLQLAMVLSSIAITTAPAGTLAVLHQYRARGPLSSTLLGVVVLDDAVGIILFSAMSVLAGGESLGAGLNAALYEITGGLLLGGAVSVLPVVVMRRTRQPELCLPLVLGAIMFVTGVAKFAGVSPLLSAMALGFLSRYFMHAAGDRLFEPVEKLEELVFLLFFTLAGVHFRPDVLVQYAGLIGIYFLARIVGKVAGAATGASVAGASRKLVRWIGFGLVPQAGVAVGLALSLGNDPAFQHMQVVIVNVIIGTTLLNELLGPVFAKFGLLRAGELGAKRAGRKP